MVLWVVLRKLFLFFFWKYLKYFQVGKTCVYTFATNLPTIFFLYKISAPLLKWFKNAVNRELQREIENLNNRVFFKEKHLKEIKNCCIKLFIFFYDVFIRDLRHIYKKKISIKWGWYCWLKCFDFVFSFFFENILD